ncbi:MAG: response regulator transcription factor [Myxococcota bacterium]|jgi:DNA-binding NarL/FixJ family response regulator|nr:response regulator transcription factor [bacterium]MDP7074345.1 response regulator transcription factor [Myxococcota bacterium]MDP7300501.1 response regulator transcription factor [Myxococcota bacterium]MDP7434098.1 response regulator transcription factor [Myxococcota bacterium]HJO24715.1 response regulator transcription factor [Myxococcota bacterium]
MLSVFVVDDHPVFRLGLSHLLEASGIHVCGEADSVESALSQIDEAKADVIIVDMSLPDGSGVRLLNELQGRPKAPPALVVSMHDESVYARRAMEAGARGYVPKADVSSRIVQAVKDVSRGRLAISDQVRRSLFVTDGFNADVTTYLDRLSDRELEIFNLVGQATATKSIATTLGISTKTVEAHQAKIKTKLGIASMAELIRAAAIWSSE